MWWTLICLKHWIRKFCQFWKENKTTINMVNLWSICGQIVEYRNWANLVHYRQNLTTNSDVSTRIFHCLLILREAGLTLFCNLLSLRAFLWSLTACQCSVQPQSSLPQPRHTRWIMLLSSWWPLGDYLVSSWCPLGDHLITTHHMNDEYVDTLINTLNHSIDNIISRVFGLIDIILCDKEICI